MQFPSPLTFLGKVWWALNLKGPMTSKQISEETGIIPTQVRMVIFEARARNVRDIRFRRVGRIREGRSTHSFVYALSNAPDVSDAPGEVRRLTQQKLSDAAQERADRKRIQTLAAECKPFRHWQDAALFGPARISA